MSQLCAESPAEMRTSLMSPQSDDNAVPLSHTTATQYLFQGARLHCVCIKPGTDELKPPLSRFHCIPACKQLFPDVLAFPTETARVYKFSSKPRLMLRKHRASRSRLPMFAGQHPCPESSHALCLSDVLVSLPSSQDVPQQ